MKSKYILCLNLLFILFTLTSCHDAIKSNYNDDQKNEIISSYEKYVHRDGKLLIQNNELISIKAVNFDNLTWFSEAKLEDGTPIFTLHHSGKDYDMVKSYGFNAIRFFINWRDLYTDPLKKNINKEGWDWLDKNIEWAKKRNIYLILDFHCPYGAFGTQSQGTWPIWTNSDVQNAFVSTWKEIAEKYKNETIVAGYDLMNEPALPVDGKQEYANLMQKTINKIREVDPNHLLIVEAAVGIEGDDKSWTRPTWVKVEEENIMYSFHFYDPLTYTHNGAFVSAKKVCYPSDLYNQKHLKNAYNEFISEHFLKEYPLFLGEFGCNDWTKDSGALQWISDVYQLCNENGIHTALFAYRSFEDFKDKSVYSFAISKMYYNANTDTGIEEVLNKDIIEFLSKKD